MSVVIPVPVGYGWVILSGVTSLVTAAYLGFQVGKARKVHGVDYPAMYDNSKPAFNAVQRGHQNMLEQHYGQLWLMSLAGLKFPISTAVAGVVWSVGRIIYAKMYASGDVKKREYGYILAGPAFLATTGMAVAVALNMLGYVKL